MSHFIQFSSISSSKIIVLTYLFIFSNNVKVAEDEENISTILSSVHCLRERHNESVTVLEYQISRKLKTSKAKFAVPFDLLV